MLCHPLDLHRTSSELVIVVTCVSSSRNATPSQKKLLWAEAVGPTNMAVTEPEACAADGAAFAAHRQNAREHKVTGKGQTEVAESCPAVTVRSGVYREY